MSVYKEILDGTHVVSQSRLKALLTDKPSSYFAESKDTDATLFGTIVDNILLEDRHDYVVSEFEPVDSAKECAQWLIEQNRVPTEENILQWCNFVSYAKNWKASTKLEKLKEGGLLTYYELLRSRKPIISKQTLTEIDNIVSHLMPFIEKDLHIQVQKRIEFDYKGVPCKGTLDWFDTQTKQIIDVKVVSEHPKVSARKHRWDIQGAFYYYSLPQGSPLPKFLVAKRYDPTNPILYQMTNNDLRTGTTGIKYITQTSVGDKVHTIEGFDQLINRYIWHSRNNLWDYRMEYYKDKYEELNLFI